MVKIRLVTVRQMEKFLESHGFMQVRHKGSHKRYVNAEGYGTTIAYHAGGDSLSKSMTSAILRQTGLTAA